jgi:hypothetical protein
MSCALTPGAWATCTYDDRLSDAVAPRTGSPSCTRHSRLEVALVWHALEGPNAAAQYARTSETPTCHLCGRDLPPPEPGSRASLVAGCAACFSEATDRGRLSLWIDSTQGLSARAVRLRSDSPGRRLDFRRYVVVVTDLNPDISSARELGLEHSREQSACTAGRGPLLRQEGLRSPRPHLAFARRLRRGAGTGVLSRMSPGGATNSVSAATRARR